MRALLKVLARLPLRVLHWLGAGAGLTAYALSPRYRRRIRENLDAAGFGDTVTPREAATEAGKAAFELAPVWYRTQAEIDTWVRDVQGWEAIEHALALGRGIILLTPHMGCFEIAAQYIARRTVLTALYREPRFRAIDGPMREGRNRGNLRAVPADVRGVRTLLGALRRGEAIGILPDQVPGKGEGEWAMFFGRPAYTMTLASRLGEKTGAAIVVLVALRLPAGRGYRLLIEPMPAALPDETPARRLNRALEAMIRRAPAQYLWSYNRFKAPASTEGPARGAPAG